MTPESFLPQAWPSDRSKNQTSRPGSPVDPQLHLPTLFIRNTQNASQEAFQLGTLDKGPGGVSRLRDFDSKHDWQSSLVKRGAIISVGGPALTYWVVPTEEELRSRYNPELLKRSLEGREERQQEFNDFVTKLKEYSKSDKPSWSHPKEILVWHLSG